MHVIQTHGGEELELHSFLTPAVEVGEWLASHSGALYPRKGLPVLLEKRAGWVSELLCILRSENAFLVLVGKGTNLPRSAGP